MSVAPAQKQLKNGAENRGLICHFYYSTKKTNSPAKVPVVRAFTYTPPELRVIHPAVGVAPIFKIACAVVRGLHSTGKVPNNVLPVEVAVYPSTSTMQTFPAMLYLTCLSASRYITSDNAILLFYYSCHPCYLAI